MLLLRGETRKRRWIKGRTRQIRTVDFRSKVVCHAADGAQINCYWTLVFVAFSLRASGQSKDNESTHGKRSRLRLTSAGENTCFSATIDPLKSQAAWTVIAGDLGSRRQPDGIRPFRSTRNFVSDAIPRLY